MIEFEQTEEIGPRIKVIGVGGGGGNAINNMIAALFITANWTVFQTDALYIDTSEPTINFEMFLPVLILYPLAIFIFSKKYKWKNWKEKLWGRIQESENQHVIDELGS